MKLAVRKRKIGNIPVLEVVPEEMIYEPLPLIIYYHGWQTSKELVLTQGRKFAKKVSGGLARCSQSWGAQDPAIGDSFINFLAKYPNQSIWSFLT